GKERTTRELERRHLEASCMFAALGNHGGTACLTETISLRNPMPELSPQLVLFVTSVSLFTATAAVFDLRIKKIPNKLTLPFFGAGLIYQLAYYQLGNGIGSPGLIDATAAFTAGFGLLWVLWMIGGGGGGDVKLMGALSVWIGFKLTC